MRTFRLISTIFRLRITPGSAKNCLAAMILCCGAASGSTLSTPTNQVQIANSRQTNRALDFTIVVPAILQILENRHPSLITSPAFPASRISVTQDIVLLSTLRKGFCMDLGLSNVQLVEWQLTVSGGSAGTSVERVGGGYRLCMARAGRYKLALQHSFNTSNLLIGAATPPTEFGWPVSLSLSTP